MWAELLISKNPTHTDSQGKSNLRHRCLYSYLPFRDRRKRVWAGQSKGVRYLVGLGGVGARVASPPPGRRRRRGVVPLTRWRRRGDLVRRGVVDLAGEPGEALPVGRDRAPHLRRRHLLVADGIQWKALGFRRGSEVEIWEVRRRVSNGKGAKVRDEDKKKKKIVIFLTGFRP